MSGKQIGVVNAHSQDKQEGDELWRQILPLIKGRSLPFDGAWSRRVPFTLDGYDYHKITVIVANPHLGRCELRVILHSENNGPPMPINIQNNGWIKPAKRDISWRDRDEVWKLRFAILRHLRDIFVPFRVAETNGGSNGQGSRTDRTEKPSGKTVSKPEAKAKKPEAKAKTGSKTDGKKTPAKAGTKAVSKSEAS